MPASSHGKRGKKAANWPHARQIKFGSCTEWVSLAGAPLDFGKGRWLDLDRGLVSATPSVHGALLRAIKEIQD